MHFQTFKNIYQGDFPVSLEVFKSDFPFVYVIPKIKIIEIPQEIQNQPNFNVYSTSEPTIQKSENLPSIKENSQDEVEYEIKNITPKKSFWRK